MGGSGEKRLSFRFDEDVVLAKAAVIRKCVAAIRSLDQPQRSGLEEWIRRDVTVLNLQRAVEALLDLANHLVSANGWDLPADARRALVTLGDHGLLSPEHLAVAQKMVGFRNIAVHDYAALDPNVVRGIAHERLGDLEQLADGILRRLRGAGAHSGA